MARGSNTASANTARRIARTQRESDVVLIMQIRSQVGYDCSPEENVALRQALYDAAGLDIKATLPTPPEATVDVTAQADFTSDAEV